MTGRVRTLAWGLSGLAMFFTAAEMLFLALNWDTPKPEDFGTRWVEIVDSVLLLMFPLMGSLIASRRPQNPIGWLLVGASLVVVTEEFAGEYALFGLETSPGALLGTGFASWWFQVTWIVSLVALPVLFLLFPSGRLLSPRWRWTIFASAIPAAIVLGPVAVRVWHRGRDLLVEPDSLTAVRDAEALIGPALLVLLAMFVVSLLAMGIRYRRSGAAEKQQIRWLFFTGILLIVVDVLIDLLLTGPPSALEELTGTISISLVPVAIAIAILRHRLFDIDRLINRAIVYALVTGSLIGVYAGTVSSPARWRAGPATTSPSPSPPSWPRPRSALCSPESRLSWTGASTVTSTTRRRRSTPSGRASERRPTSKNSPAIS